MKVIEKGPAFLVEWSCEVTCKHCQSILLLETNDIKVSRSSSGRDWDCSVTVLLAWKCVMCDETQFLVNADRDSYFKGHPKVRKY